MNHHEGIQSFLYYSEPRGDANTLCPGSLNTLAPWTGTPVKVGEVENGALYIAGDGDDQLYGEFVSIPSACRVLERVNVFMINFDTHID